MKTTCSVPLKSNQGTGKTDEIFLASPDTGPYAFSISSKGRKDTTEKSVYTRYKRENHSKYNTTDIAWILKSLTAKGKMTTVFAAFQPYFLVYDLTQLFLAGDTKRRKTFVATLPSTSFSESCQCVTGYAARNKSNLSRK